MGTFNTYGNKSNGIGSSLSIWLTIRQKERGGGTLENIEPNTVLKAGSLVSLENNVAKVVKTFEVASAVTATDTVVKVKALPTHPTPTNGLILMKAPSTATGKGKAATISNVTFDSVNDVYELTIAAGDLGTLVVGDILINAASAGASVPIYAIPSGLTQNDVYMEDGVYAATVASVFDGEIMEDRIQPIPDFVKVLLPQIKFTKGI